MGEVFYRPYFYSTVQLFVNRDSKSPVSIVTGGARKIPNLEFDVYGVTRLPIDAFYSDRVWYKVIR